MATFLDAKRMLAHILCVQEAIDETDDIRIPISQYRDANDVIFSNEKIKTMFDSIQTYQMNNLELYTRNAREIALQIPRAVYREFSNRISVSDAENNLTYSIGPATQDYCMRLIQNMADYANANGRRVFFDLRFRCRNFYRGFAEDTDLIDPVNILQKVLQVYTLKVESDSAVGIEQLRKYAASYEFLYMYRRNDAITEYADFEDMFTWGRPQRMRQAEAVDTPPLRIYDSDALDYYTLGMESTEPFIRYISFYHVIEHYFDTVFRRKLTEAMRMKITGPGFSYKSEEKLYELAKYVKKHMSSDDDSGKGNEKESLKYVLMEYVPIEELKDRIKVLDPTAVAYYQSNKVPFVTEKDTKIPWSDTQGIYSKLTQRIYETRNALVHSKSEQAANQYKPYKDKKDLLHEIALIQAVAELVLIKSSEEL